MTRDEANKWVGDKMPISIFSKYKTGYVFPFRSQHTHDETIKIFAIEVQKLVNQKLKTQRDDYLQIIRDLEYQVKNTAR